MTMLPTFLAGTNWVMHSAGWLESGLASCYEKFIVDIEILRMMHEEFKPFEIAEESLGLGRPPGGRARRPLLRRGAHARPVPGLLLPAAAVVDQELRALAAPRRRRRHRPRREDLARDVDNYERRRWTTAIAQELDEYVTRRRRELGD